MGLAPAAVEEAELAASLVERVDRVVTDEHDTRALGHVGVVGDVDHQLLERSLLDPAMKDGNGVLEPDRREHGADRVGAAQPEDALHVHLAEHEGTRVPGVEHRATPHVHAAIVPQPGVGAYGKAPGVPNRR